MDDRLTAKESREKVSIYLFLLERLFSAILTNYGCRGQDFRISCPPLGERVSAEENRVQVMKGRLEAEANMLEMRGRDVRLGRDPRPKDEDEGGRDREEGVVRIPSMFKLS